MTQMSHLLAACRAEAGLTQAELARRAGTSQATISAYENGSKSPSVATLERLLAVTGNALDVRAVKRSAADFSGPLGRALRSSLRDVRRVLARHGASQPRVFGSVARGAERTDSDLDLLVRLDDTATLITLSALERELSELLGLAVEVLTDGALDAADPEFRSAVRAEAVPL